LPFQPKKERGERRGKDRGGGRGGEKEGDPPDIFIYDT